MKLLSMLAGLSLCTVIATPLLASEAASGLTGCQAKIQDIKNKIEIAQQRGNTTEVAGLQTALGEANGCTEKSLKAERESKVEKARQKVSEREQDLKEASDKGDKEKIVKRQAKLAESRKELQDATDELSR